MLRILILCCLAWFLSFTQIQAQVPVDVAENTLKVSALGEEVFYYGFAEGDQLIFSFQEINGKELKEIEITELPASSKFMDFKTKKIENKTININRNAIYKFRFANGAIIGRICKFKIQRIPASGATKNFNTNVYWRTIYDTTYTTEQERYLVKSDTIISNLMEQKAKVHSRTNSNATGNLSVTDFALPEHTVAWSYYLDVNQAGEEAFKEATANLAQNASPLVSKIPGYGPLAVLSLGGASYLANVQGSESVQYYLVDGSNANLYNTGQQFNYIKGGTVVTDFSRMNRPLRGQLYFYLINQNLITAIDVSIKVMAIVVNNEWGERPITRMHINQRQEAYLQR